MSALEKRSTVNPWKWVPTLYFTEGIPYCVVNVLAVILLKNLGMDNAQLAFYTSLLSLPWILKPIWTPLTDITLTHRRWILLTEYLGAAFIFLCPLLLAFFPTPFAGILLALAALGFISATHDAVADGFYLIALNSQSQAIFTGVRSTMYRISMVVLQGGIVVCVGLMYNYWSSYRIAWIPALVICGLLLLAVAVWHTFSLPFPVARSNGLNMPFGGRCGVLYNAKHDGKRSSAPSMLFPVSRFALAFFTFFQKRGVWRMLVFLLLYRLAESQLTKLAAPFFLDKPEKGGLGFSVATQGLVYGTVGVICLLVGGILGGFLVAKYGLGKCMLGMALAINIPDVVYVVMACFPPASPLLASVYVALEQFGYGLGFTLYMLAMVAFSEDSGEYSTSHFAIMTGFMALGMMLPGMVSGFIQSCVGYKLFFVFVMICTIPSIASIGLLKGIVRRDFGLK